MPRPLPSSARRLPAGTWQPYYEPHEHTHLPGGRDPINGTGGYALKDESFITAVAEAGLTAERVLTAGTGITLTDGGANSTMTVALSAVAQLLGVEEQDGAPTVSNVVSILVPNGSLTNIGGAAAIDMEPEFVLFNATDLCDGARVAFDLPDFFRSPCIVWQAGHILQPVVDYTESANFDSITLASAPADNTVLLIYYEIDAD